MEAQSKIWENLYLILAGIQFVVLMTRFDWLVILDTASTSTPNAIFTNLFKNLASLDSVSLIAANSAC
jgi:DNA recombination-dependent growth factor C